MKKFFSIIAILALLCACQKPTEGFDDDSKQEPVDRPDNDHHASATTMPATEITMSSAVLNGSVSVDSQYSSIEFGMLITNSQANITSHIGQRLKSSKQSLGDFSVRINGLSPSTTYYYQAYLILDGRVLTFGQPVQFVTKGIAKGSENGHDYIDLGLSVKWATMNIGASYPETAGTYFAWGETSSKANNQYTWSSYKWGNPEKSTLTKYNSDSFNGKVDYKTTLELADDAARANWGGTWRTPTKAEWDELLTKCNWEWTTEYGTAGYEISSPDGNKIFLPAVGYLSNGSRHGYGSDGYYWTSTLDSNSTLAYCLWFYSNFYPNHKKVNWCNPRCTGLTVRAVCQ